MARGSISGMAKKKNSVAIEDAGEPPVTTENEPSGFVPRANAAEAPRKKRISFNLTDEGRLDTDSLRTDNRGKLEEFFRDPANWSGLGVGPAPSADAAEAAFTDQDARQALRFLNGVNAGATAFILKRFKGIDLSPEVMNAAFAVPAQIESELCQRGARLMNKYSTNWMREHADLVLFAALYFDLVKTQVISAYLLQMQLNQAAANPPAETEKTAVI